MKQVLDHELRTILRIAEDCLNVPGDFVELGCFEGDTSLLLAEILKNNNSRKKLWIYDSFEGLPRKTEKDFSELGKDFKEGELFTTKRFVKQRFLRANLPVPIIKKAWFSDLKNENLPEKIAFAFLDGDLYESIKDSLKLVVPKLEKNGRMVIHDYDNPQLPGVTKAVEEFLSSGGFKMKIVSGVAILSKA